MRSKKKSPPTPIPGYRLLEPLGKGGFGEVWKCEAPGGLLKAIKFVYGNASCLDTGVDPALEELQAVERIKSIRHPFLLSLDRVEVVDNDLVVVMELADKSLYDLLTECREGGLAGLPRDKLLGYLREVAEALDVINQEYGLQHLDVKPRNLFLVSNHVKIGDFGVVNSLWPLNGDRVPLGALTPLYAAPEACLGRLGPHCDQYSLAIVYQELLTGTLPFGGKTPQQVMVQQVEGRPNLAALPPGDRPLVARALAKDPQQRFASCSAFVAALIDNAGSAAQPRARRGPAPAGMTETVNEKNLTPRQGTALVAAAPAPPLLPRAETGTPPPLNPILAELVAARKAEETRQDTLPQIAVPFVQQRYISKLTPDLVRLKLDVFRREWQGQVLRDDDKLYMFHVPETVGFWERWVSRQAGLTVQVLLPPPGEVGLTTHVTVKIKPFGCGPEQGVRLLKTWGPLLLQSAAACFEVTAERRRLERIVWQRPLPVRFVLPDRNLGDPVDGRGKDLSSGGVGFYLPATLLTAELNVNLDLTPDAPAVMLPAYVVRVQRRHDGWYEVGAAFS
jgi:hypothetical protein